MNDTEIKSINIKSPYGSGKTKFLKNIVSNENNKRILWVSYRITLTDDILNEFQKFGFGSYLNNEYSNDKLIIQLESLKHLQNLEFENDEGEKEITSYDLIIIDEIESVLNHFDSTTFKGENKETFNYLFNIIDASKKVISLDSDMSNRSLEFISNFGKMKTIINEYNKNERTFNIISNEAKFNQELINEVDKALKENKKIGMVFVLCQKMKQLIIMNI